jgi:hypothetical protein
MDQTHVPTPEVEVVVEAEAVVEIVGDYLGVAS